MPILFVGIGSLRYFSRLRSKTTDSSPPTGPFHEPVAVGRIVVAPRMSNKFDSLPRSYTVAVSKCNNRLVPDIAVRGLAGTGYDVVVPNAVPLTRRMSARYRL